LQSLALAQAVESPRQVLATFLVSVSQVLAKVLAQAPLPQQQEEELDSDWLQPKIKTGEKEAKRQTYVIIINDDNSSWNHGLHHCQSVS
jgi:hypothetical protein